MNKEQQIVEFQKAHNKGVQAGFDMTKFRERSISKQAVEEFAEKLKEKAHKGASNDVITYKFIERDYTITESELNELLTEYENER